MKQQKQSGFSHIVIITAILAVGLVGTLGFVFYQNFIQKKATTDTAATTSKTSSTTQSKTTSVTKPGSTADWLNYDNAKYSFSIKYPSTWTHREYPSGDGVGFSLPNDPSHSEFLSIQYVERGTANYDSSFNDYVRIAGPQEIQGFQSLESINKVTTISGITGYIVNWNVVNIDGSHSREDITYFPLKNGSTHGQIELMGGSSKYPTEYAEMIKTFSYK